MFNTLAFSTVDSSETNSTILKENVKGTSRKIRKRRHVPHSQLPTDLVEKRNSRERERIHAVNDAFEELRKHIPYTSDYSKMSKVNILVDAIFYIKRLTEILGKCQEQKTSYDLRNKMNTFSQTPATVNNNTDMSDEKSMHTMNPDSLQYPRENKYTQEKVMNCGIGHEHFTPYSGSRQFTQDPERTSFQQAHYEQTKISPNNKCIQESARLCGRRHVLCDLTNLSYQHYHRRQCTSNIRASEAKSKDYTECLTASVNWQYTELCYKAENFVEELIPPLLIQEIKADNPILEPSIKSVHCCDDIKH